MLTKNLILFIQSVLSQIYYNFQVLFLRQLTNNSNNQKMKIKNSNQSVLKMNQKQHQKVKISYSMLKEIFILLIFLLFILLITYIIALHLQQIYKVYLKANEVFIFLIFTINIVQQPYSLNSQYFHIGTNDVKVEIENQEFFLENLLEVFTVDD